MRRLARGPRVSSSDGRSRYLHFLSAWIIGVYLLMLTPASLAQTPPKVTIAYAAVSPMEWLG